MTIATKKVVSDVKMVNDMAELDWVFVSDGILSLVTTPTPLRSLNQQSRMDISTSKSFAFYTNMENDNRNTLSSLCCALQGLTDVQNSDIRDMGFESIKSFNIHNIPTGWQP
ncbi:hypothetical protein Hanom_Chr02g00100471 [Helianthus anomalus]